jgi:hypothetical protein
MNDPALEVIAKTLLGIRTPGPTFSGVVVCKHCRTELARTTEPVTAGEKEWVESMRIHRAGPCPKGCAKLKHGMNFDTEVEWTENEG